MPVIHAKSKKFKDKVHLITAAVDAPQVEKSREHCAAYNSYLSDGALCYRVCGVLPKGKSPIYILSLPPSTQKNIRVNSKI